MKAGDMYGGQEVAFKTESYTSDRHLSHGQIIQVATGGGQGQKHLVELLNEDGTSTGTRYSIIGRWIVEPWHDYKARMGEWLDQKTEQEFKNKLRQEVTAMHLKQAEDLMLKFTLLGIGGRAATTGLDPLDDNSFGAYLIITHLDNIQELVEDAVRRKFTGS